MSGIKTIKIGDRLVGKGQPVFVIAEAGVNHNGRLSLALKLVDAAKKAGADAVKFQDFKAGEVVTEEGKMAGYQKRNTGKNESQLEMLKTFELSAKDWRKIAAYCRKKNVIFLSTPHGGFASVDRVRKLGAPAFKFGSGDLTNLPLLEYAARFKKPMIISTGMATMKEIEEAVAFVKKAGNDKIIVLQCTTDYPAKNKEINLRAMETMRRKLKTLVGFSDHTLGTLASLAAVSLGASAIEKHMTLSKKLPGPDQKASLEPDEFKLMTEKIRQIPVILGSALKKPMPSELAYRPLVRKSIVAFRNIRKGEKLSLKNLAIKRPGTGLQPKFLSKVLGKTAKKNIAKDNFIRWGVIK